MSLSWWKQLYDDERGTTMTEFIMTVPIFIVCFVGIVQLGLFNEKSVKTWARAHRNTFELVTRVSNPLASPYAQPTAGAALSAGTLALGGQPINAAPAGYPYAMLSETGTWIEMARRGHWGESNARTLPADAMLRLTYVDGNVTANPNRIMGNSRRFTKDLVDENVGNFSSGGGGSALGVLNGVISGSGIRPALGAGMRYGAVGAYADDNLTIMGRSISTRAHFNCLVPPRPLTGAEAEWVPTAITRLTMESYREYTGVLGISGRQRYPGGSLSTPRLNCLPLNEWHYGGTGGTNLNCR